MIRRQSYGLRRWCGNKAVVVGNSDDGDDRINGSGGNDGGRRNNESDDDYGCQNHENGGIGGVGFFRPVWQV